MTSYRQLLACLMFIALSACTTTPPPHTAPEPEPAPAAEIPGTIETKIGPKRTIKTTPPETLISIAAVGDMMIGTDFPRNHLPDDDGVSFFSAVTPFLSAADIAVGNLEGTLLDGGEPAKQCKNLNACYLFRSPTRYAQHYRDAGFDALSVANNHARDFGEDGRTATMQALDAVGIHHSGRAGEFASFETKGLSIAFLAFAVTQKSNLLHDYELAEETVAGFAATHDIVIVTFHGGAEGASMMHVPFAEEEYYGEPRGDVTRFSRSMVDAGADLVLGHGPHVVRGMERYKDRLIAYSLGNFATYYGISVEGAKGIAPILVATLNEKGEFVEGEIVSTVQLRPDGPSIDAEQRALNLIRGLSIEDFDEPGLVFHPDGRIRY
ncbi:MAG: CapA family protein [Woeseiaceae bacterium]